jgi:hypothetical protein
MPTPTIPAGNLFFNATLYTGNNGTASITNGVAGQSFQPDFVWVKNRTTAYTHLLYDSVRGVGTLKAISSSETTAEGGMSDNSTFGFLSALNSNGFTVVSGSTANSYTNSSGNNYVAWNWKAGGAAVTNTAGSITSTVSANTTAGFSIVKWTGTGSNGSVGHGLGVAPRFIILKDTSNSYNWYVFTTATGSNLRFEGLNTTSDASSQPSQYTTTSTLIENLTGIASLNTSGANMLVYCWAPIAGYSAFGSYTGNGSSDGPFVYTGFRPRFIMVKRSDSTGNWILWDTARNTFNVTNNVLYPNLSQAEDSPSSQRIADILSNGFKIRGTDTDVNASGGTYIYMAFAENPFKYALAR